MVPCQRAVAFCGIAVGLFLSPNVVMGEATLAVNSVDGNAHIDLSCPSAKTIDVTVLARRQPPVIQAPDYQAGAGRKSAVQYTVDGKGPFLEDWVTKENGLAPSTSDQLRDFVALVVNGRIMFLSVRGMQPFEFQLNRYAEQFKSFAAACKANR